MPENSAETTKISPRKLHSLAITEVVLTAAIWSSSFIGVKVALEYTGPFTIAGLRYFLAFLFLAPWLIHRRHSLKSLTAGKWLRLSGMGIAQFTIGNGALFIALKTLPATAGSLALCLVPIPVLLLGVIVLKEKPRLVQLIGVLISVGASAVFYREQLFELHSPLAIVALVVAIISFAFFPVLARGFARTRQIGNISLTGIPLGIGGAILLVMAAVSEGIPHMPLSIWGIILGLAAVNTLVGYLLFTHSLQHLTAVEANVILNLIPLITAIIAWMALDEHLTTVQLTAIFFVVIGASLVQRKKTQRSGQT